MTVAAPAAAPGAHLRLLARLARFLRDRPRVAGLLSAAEGEALLAELLAEAHAPEPR